MTVYQELAAGVAAIEAKIAISSDEDRSQLEDDRNFVAGCLGLLRRAGYGGIEQVVQDLDHLEP